ncbi:MAG: PAS domain S-box protein, partial [Deltaproteobacteria bacterium]|nr:PAS domain S-box protein [Deltaproteobacteria bacterium]
EVDVNKGYTWSNQAGLDFFGEDVIGKEVAYYFEGEQDMYEVLDPLLHGEEDPIYVRSWQRGRDGKKSLLAWRFRVLKDAAGNVTGAISTARDITERKLAEEAVTRERILSDHIINSLPGIFYMFDDQGKLARWNKKYEEVTGYSHEESFGMHILDFFPEEHKHTITLRVQSVFAEGEAFAEIPLMTKGEEQIPYFFTGRLTVLDGKQYLLGVGIDMTERMRAEKEKDALQAQLLQAQKMESVGRLAGGVAHDFNNMLSAIIGHAELAIMRCTPSEPIHASLKVIEDSAHRSAELTRQLLAFARKQTVAPKVLNINDTIANMLKMLLRLIGEDIDIVWKPEAGLWQVKIDPSQIDQLLANVCINARDAIAGVGKVTIETKNAGFDEADCAVHHGFACGEYVMLAVSDDGCGMSKEVLDHLFEPFFTTKDMGKGTGLGLATVYGIVKQNEGFVNVYSEPDKGTTFKIYLSRFVGEAAAPKVESTMEMPKGCGEMLLLVEDEPVILDVSREMLEQLGYVVLIAGTSGEALRQAKAYAAEIELLITDVVMPEMNGRDLAKLISNIKPGLKCLFISGYTANVIAHHGVLDEGVNFLQKPFSMKDLASKVRQALERE